MNNGGQRPRPDAHSQVLPNRLGAAGQITEHRPQFSSKIANSSLCRFRHQIGHPVLNIVHGAIIRGSGPLHAILSNEGDLMSTIANHELLAAALVGYQARLAEIDEKIAEIHAQLGSRGVPATSAVSFLRSKPQRKVRKQSAGRNGRKVMAKKKTGKKRVLSAAAIKRISEATKKRWAAYRAAQAKPAEKVKPNQKPSAA